MLTATNITIAVGAILLAGCISRPPAPRTDGTVAVTLSLQAPGAASVCMAGSFNRWSRDAHCMRGPGRDGAWTILLDLPPGRYEYLFVLDGSEWVPDPAAPFADDGLGGRNSVLVVPAD
jgi:1,4-alpha-glucan branching enzyme